MEEEFQFPDETCDKLGLSIAELERLLKNFNTVEIGLVDAATSHYLFKEACRKSDSQDELEEELRKTRQDLVMRLIEKARGVRQLVLYNDAIDPNIADRCDFLAGRFTLGEFIHIVGMLAGGEDYGQAPWIRKRLDPKQIDRSERSSHCREHGTNENVHDKSRDITRINPKRTKKTLRKQSGPVSPKIKGSPQVTGPNKTRRRSERLAKKAKAGTV
ncbi:hypothetical protein FOPG_18462 [Fusarium oxysporum f. sp. conglutinans race 2 54008]|uniref:Uncharacterized protein n=1 Tax=Fusarium oxysporum f. sp. conglutinans race 2 54008 TaxID=1089457 RepID=X0GZM8_FUSOX|nr:hypothetical protein FOPG_18462 [Fusarium oxysporum f. sp. conglutinans race 2 54008]